jgi:ArsR family transcriptional regulator
MSDEPDPLKPQECARSLRALADPERLRIVGCLRDGPMNVGELAARLDSQVVNVSHHLGVLRQAGLVLDEKQGRFVVYRLHPSVYRPHAGRSEHLDLGCCRLEIPRPVDERGSS